MQLAIHQFMGEGGLKSMSRETVRAAPSASLFAATLTRAQMGSLVVDEFRSTAYGGRRSAEQVRADRLDTIHLVFVVAGAIRVRQDGRDCIASAGEATLLRSNAPFEYSVTAGYECVTLTVLRSRLRVRTAAQLPGQTARIHSGLFVDSLLGFLRPCLEPAPVVDPYVTAVENAIVALTTTLLTESSLDASPAEYELIVEKAHAIIRHDVRCRGLGAASISAELGISPRSLYRSFRENGTAVTDEIRLLRVRMIADELALDGRGSSMETLARSHGFRSADVCGRVFKAHYGQSMGAYRRTHTQGRLKPR